MADSKAFFPPNPYRWDAESTESIERFVGRRALLNEGMAICNGGEVPSGKGQPPETFQGGGVFVLLGTRGMGKSTFLAKLGQEFRTVPGAGIVVLSFSTKPIPRFHPQLSAADVVAVLTEKLIDSVPSVDGNDLRAFRQKLEELGRKNKLVELFDTYLNERTHVERIVVMYDELDSYADPPSVAHNFFNPLEDARKKLHQRLAIVAAGGLGMLTLRTVLGSSMFTRASRKVLEPFAAEELAELALPFQERGTPLSQEVLTTLLHLSGGNLALATYGLEKCWAVANPTPENLVFMFERFRDDRHDIVKSIRESISGFHGSEIPFQVWERLRSTSSGLTKHEFRAMRTTLKVEAKIEDKDILDVLRAAGFIRMEPGAWNVDPIIAQIIPSILTFDLLPRTTVATATLQEQLRLDLVEAMAFIHRVTPAFYRPASKGQKAQLVPEMNFSAFLLFGLKLRGWQGNLEPLSGGGYVDIKATYPARFGEQEAIIEVKRWDGPDYVANIHNQIKKYFAHGVTAMATAVIGDIQDPAWKDTYKSACLDGKADGTAVWKELERPLEGYFEGRWESRAVEHFLLRLAARE